MANSHVDYTPEMQPVGKKSRESLWKDVSKVLVFLWAVTGGCLLVFIGTITWVSFPGYIFIINSREFLHFFLLKLLFYFILSVLWYVPLIVVLLILRRKKKYFIFCFVKKAVGVAMVIFLALSVALIAQEIYRIREYMF